MTGKIAYQVTARPEAVQISACYKFQSVKSQQGETKEKLTQTPESAPRPSLSDSTSPSASSPARTRMYDPPESRPVRD